MAVLLSQGDMESGVGNPYIPTGWTSVGLGVGDTAAEAAVIHAGAQSILFNVGASAEGIRQQITAAIGSFVQVSIWTYGDGSAGFTIGGLDATQLVVQATPATFNVSTPHTAEWALTTAVFRVVAANPSIYILADAGAAGTRYIDDVYAFVLAPVSLTITPASEANSLEGTGIRVDGLDSLTQPILVGQLSAFAGQVAWQTGQRHDDGEIASFGNAQPTVALFWGDANNFFYVAWTAANTLTVAFDAAGAGFVFANWATGGAFFVPGVDHVYRVRYTGGFMQLIVDGVIRATIVAPTGFTTIPATAYWGTSVVGDNQLDAVYSAP